MIRNDKDNCLHALFYLVLYTCNVSSFISLFHSKTEIVTQNRLRSSDGESDQTSGASDESHTPVRRRHRPGRLHRRFSEVSQTITIMFREVGISHSSLWGRVLMYMQGTQIELYLLFKKLNSWRWDLVFCKVINFSQRNEVVFAMWASNLH